MYIYIYICRVHIVQKGFESHEIPMRYANNHLFTGWMASKLCLWGCCADLARGAIFNRKGSSCQLQSMHRFKFRSKKTYQSSRIQNMGRDLLWTNATLVPTSSQPSKKLRARFAGQRSGLTPRCSSWMRLGASVQKGAKTTIQIALLGTPGDPPIFFEIFSATSVKRRWTFLGKTRAPMLVFIRSHAFAPMWMTLGAAVGSWSTRTLGPSV